MMKMMTSETKETAYTAERQQMYFDLEDASWWFQHRADIFLYLAKKYLRKTVQIFDIGGSNGFNSKKLQDAGYDVILVEPTQKACENARLRGVRQVVNLPFQEITEDILQFVCTDVIEHIKDDRAFVSALYQKMPYGGKGLISVPASMKLWSSEDEVDGHYRRYSVSSLSELLEGAGFRIVYINHCFQFLWLPIYIRRHLMEKLSLVHKVQERAEEEEQKVTNHQFLSDRSFITTILNRFRKRDLQKIKREQRIPYGSSIVCVVEKVRR